MNRGLLWFIRAYAAGVVFCGLCWAAYMATGGQLSPGWGAAVMVSTFGFTLPIAATVGIVGDET